MITNLDALSEVRQEVIHAGKKHIFQDYIVEDYIAYKEKVEKGQIVTKEEQAEALGAIMCPDLNINKLTTQQLTIVNELFIKEMQGEVSEKKRQEVLNPQK